MWTGVRKSTFVESIAKPRQKVVKGRRWRLPTTDAKLLGRGMRDMPDKTMLEMYEEEASEFSRLKRFVVVE